MSDVVIVSAGGGEKAVPVLATQGPAFVRPGTGGTRIRMFNGQETTIAGETLRTTLSRRRIRKPFIAGDPIMNGTEIQIDADVLAGWLARGATDLGPLCVVVDEEKKPEMFHKPVGTGAQNGLNVK